MVEISQHLVENQIKYVSFWNNRKPKYRLKTIMQGDKVYKYAINEFSRQHIQNIKNTTSFIKPVEGTISSKYGQRDNANGSIPKNHTGTDIASMLGSKIIASTDGEVVLASEEGDYRKTFEDSNGRS